ncbi:MAG: Rrf2 family transcriptional regulator [Acidobacteria bacterium]|nr:Rrf2 family transcriptional regulator [Acidobacteriota bacterium]MBI3488142.1 Rrf2 family transcriptional regulator [Acidobacteriota bacterium]
MSNTRFTVAIHVLTLLAYCGPEALTSEFIAGSVNTNPVVIRRILSTLREAKLVASQAGPGGGWQLLRDPRKITLRDILAAVSGDPTFLLHSAPPNIECPVGRDIQAILARRFQSAQEAMERDLERTTIAQLISEVGGGSA